MKNAFEAERFPEEPVPPRLERAWALGLESVWDAVAEGIREQAYPGGSMLCLGTVTIYIEGRHRPFEAYTQWLQAPDRPPYVPAAADNHELLEAIYLGDVRAEVRFSEPYRRVPANPWDLLGRDPEDLSLTVEQVEKEARETYDIRLDRRTIRYYQALGLIPRPRRVRGYVKRRYANDTPARLLAIRRLLAEGYRLGEISEALKSGVIPTAPHRAGSDASGAQEEPRGRVDRDQAGEL